MIERDRALRVLLTLAIAAVGGAVLGLLNLPAGWLTGGMVAVAVAALARAPVEITVWLRDTAFIVVGCFLGSSVSPELVSELPRWPISLAVLAVNLIALQWCAQMVLEKGFGWDRQTAFFAATPGLTSYVIALALPTKADISRIAVSQTIRVFLLVALLPKAVSLAGAGGGAVAPAVPPVSLFDLLVTLCGGAVGGLALAFGGLPAGGLLGALLVSGILHGTGLVAGGLPQPLLIAAYIVLGALIGTRFVGTTLATLASMSLASVAAFLVSVIIGIFGAWIAAWLTGEPLSQMVLAFAPGGIDIMTIMAFALGLDAAFVAAHQLARFALIAVYVPVLLKRTAPPEEDR
jgi:membrane AbrB-like protein